MAPISGSSWLYSYRYQSETRGMLATETHGYSKQKLSGSMPLWLEDPTLVLI